MTHSDARPAAAAIDLSKRDLTLDLARVVCVALVVCIHLLMVGVGTAADGSLVVTRPLEAEPWFWIATWIGQIMPLFFVVGGFASLTAWRSLQRRGGGASDYVRTRMRRLAQPAVLLFLFYVVVVGAATAIGIDPVLLDGIVSGAGFPLWFLAAYAACQALVPLMAGLHARAPRRTLIVLLALVVVFDSLRFTLGVTELGLPNMVFVWLLVQQFGFWYADGWFAARTGWQLFGLTVAAYALLAAISLPPQWYSPDMLANLNPPTLPLVCLAVAQACILRALRPVLARVMETRAARAAVFFAGTRLMTIYLWHLPLIIILSGVALLIPGASPEPSSPAWWLSRPLFLLVLLGVLFALSLILARFEVVTESGVTPRGWIVAAAALLTFLPAFAITEWFLDLPLAIAAAVSYSVVLQLLRRRGGGAPVAPAAAAAAAAATAAGAGAGAGAGA